MGKPTGFLEYQRELPAARDPRERVRDFKEIYEAGSEEKTRQQAARCMDCGVPFCHNGCPLGNLIPDFNEAVQEGNWPLAYRILSSTNNFPEFTGRICPAPCESACVLGINKPAVTIEYIEKQIIEQAFSLGLVQAQPPAQRSGKRVAVIGSGPAGLAAADQLNRAGHQVTVFERDRYPGGLLRYGVPDFKLEKWVVERRVALLEAEGIEFRCGVQAGEAVTAADLRAQFDAVVLCTGATVPRGVSAPGSGLQGIHFAMEYLTRQNQLVSAERQDGMGHLDAAGKHVLVIGGGDTGSDCIGTANRQGAASVTQITWGPKPPLERGEEHPWPYWPATLQTTSSHEEGCDRKWSVLLKSFEGNAEGEVCGLRIAEIAWKNGRSSYEEIPGTERVLPCGLALIAVGFSHPEHAAWLEELGVRYDARGNIAAEGYEAAPGVFAAGDSRRGQSLVVWAISEGREAARAADLYLSGSSRLPSRTRAQTQLSA
ncbi:MAG: glutamate synthase subunit beta [Bacteroidia bacterium]|nr:glutamate synthase subunit beta [Bacteroidia bacterium]